MTSTPSEIYAALRAQTIEMVIERGDELTRKVPQCPDWSVKDVVAHVVGIVADFLAGNLDGIGTDPWTAAQVSARSEATIAEVCAEWLELADEIDSRTAAEPFIGVRLNADLVTHVHDLAAALDTTVDRDSAAVRLGLERYGPAFCERVAEAGLPVVRVEAGEQQWQSGEGRPAAVVRGTAFELLRALTGRRSVEQVRDMDWTGDHSPYLGVISPYGLPTEPVVE